MGSYIYRSSLYIVINFFKVLLIREKSLFKFYILLYYILSLLILMMLFQSELGWSVLEFARPVH